MLHRPILPLILAGILGLGLAGVLCANGLAQDEPAATAPEATADAPAAADEAPAEAEAAAPSMAVLDDMDALWTCVAAFLVFFMQAGFAMVETGLTRAKNACNILMKNLMDFAVGSVAFWLVGFGIMFGVTSTGWFGTNNFFFDAVKEVPALGKSVSFGWSFLIFQTVFCATAATIVSGAMAERTKFVSYLIYSAVISALLYPIFGSWAWGSLWAGGGWLEGKGFHDFAGSTVVHSMGGWAALAGALVLGPRIGKYTKDGKINPIPGHNIPLVALGVFILWLGWFGFNPGSTTSVSPYEDPNGVIGTGFASIAVTTNLAAATGAIAAMITTWLAFKKPDPSLTLNGALAGLVAITAGCDVTTPMTASIIGLVAGVLVIGSVVFFDKIRIDDPVGAVSVHGVCGAWGTLATGLFATKTGLFMGGGADLFISQIIGVVSCFAFMFPAALILFLALKYTVGLRVSEQEEIEGLDIHEHGLTAYPAAWVADMHPGGAAYVKAAAPAMASAPIGHVSTEGAS